jgi:hypothetical protein
MQRDAIGLCGTCKHARVITSARGSTFYLCRLAETDARFRKYPALPVLRCDGYAQKQDSLPQDRQ